MLSSLKLGKIFGIDFFIHPTFWLLPLIVLLSGLGTSAGQIAFDLLFVFAVFACVALHEIGHALAAAAYGIRTRHITLFPIGGVAALERMPEKPAREIAVALAGPAVNVVIAVLLTFFVVASGMLTPWDVTANAFDRFVVRLIEANVVLVLFNLLPCFPMDGGRVFRALLSIRMTRLRATEIAAQVGIGVAVLMVVAGIALGNFGLVAVAIVVALLGRAELMMVRAHEAHRDYERRARELFGMPPEPDPDEEPRRPAPVPASPSGGAARELAGRRFSGLAWDAERRVWVQWLNGVPVRDVG